MVDGLIDILPYLLLALAVLILLKRAIRFFVPYKKTPFGFKGKLVYVDKGKRSATFLNKQYGIAAKGGDFIYLTEHGKYKLIEYKSRKGKVYQSDEAQTIASVLAARSRYPIVEAVIFTESTSKNLNVSGCDEVLYNKIKDAHLLTQQIKNGKPVHTTNAFEYKCRSCSMRKFCNYKT
jgi:CRISPR-associated exonuclease Cas4